MMNRVAPEAVSLRIFFVVLRFQIKSGKAAPPHKSCPDANSGQRQQCSPA
jgi:hypothetical protein